MEKESVHDDQVDAGPEEITPPAVTNYRCLPGADPVSARKRLFSRINSREHDHHRSTGPDKDCPG